MAMQRKKVLFLLIWWVTDPTIVLADASLIYKKHLQAGIEAFTKYYDREAERNLKEAHLIFPYEREPIQYLGLLRKRQLVGQIIAARARVIALTMAKYSKNNSALASTEETSAVVEQRLRKIDTLLKSQPQSSKQIDNEKPKLTKTATTPTKKSPYTHNTAIKKKIDIGLIYLDDIVKAAGEKADISIELDSSWIIEGKNIKKFLVIDEGLFVVDMVSRDRIRVTAQRHGNTFLHIWDDIGRRTILVTVILPARTTESTAMPMSTTEHVQPLKFSYSTDGNRYYHGNNIPNMERRSMSFIQQLGVEAATPYGLFDASGTMQRYDRITHIPNYTVGMSNVPLPGTRNLDIRFFDATRNLSPLTLPGTYLRGEFVDVNLLEDSVRLSATHGKYQQAVASYERGSSQSQDVYVEAGKLVLFPKDQNKYYALNYANSYGPNRQKYLSRDAYSIEGMQKINEITLKGELARDIDHLASTTGLQWENGSFKSAFYFRDINKNFTNVTAAPSNQGEIGSTWTTDLDLEHLVVNTSVDIYRDTLYFNPNDPQALNYDMRAHVRNALLDDTWLDSSATYVHTPGDISPHRNTGLYERLSRQFYLWKDRRATVFIGSSYQRSRYSNSAASEFNRCSLITGLQVPITDGLACYLNYEYSFVDELSSHERYSPKVLNTGLTYNKSITEHINGNWGLSYRNEGNVKGTNSFLTGEDSLSGSSGFTYNPTHDVSFFVDGRMRTVWPVEKSTPSYDDLDLRLGMRAVWGAPVYWDPSGIITGMVCLDQDGNGKCTLVDKGLYGITVKVGNKETTTDDKGKYRIEISAKSVLVTPVLTTLPPGAIFTTSSSVKVDISQGKLRRADFGVKISSGIYGVVFIDMNGNRIPDSGDQFIGRIKLILDSHTSQFTDNRGVYLFKDIAPGRHLIEIDMKVLPDGLIPLIKLKNEVNVTEGTTYVLHIPMQIQKPKVRDGEATR